MRADLSEQAAGSRRGDYMSSGPPLMPPLIMTALREAQCFASFDRRRREHAGNGDLEDRPSETQKHPAPLSGAGW